MNPTNRKQKAEKERRGDDDKTNARHGYAHTTTKSPLQTQMRHTRTRTCKEIRALHRACPSRLHIREMSMVMMMVMMPLLLLLLEPTGRILSHRFPFGIIQIGRAHV